MAKTRKTATLTSYGNVSEMANDVRGVLKSIINQDGRFSTKEASVVSKLYGTELSRMKLQVEIHKINTKISARKTSADEVLSLT